MEQHVDRIVPYIPKAWGVSWDAFSDIPDEAISPKSTATLTNTQRKAIASSKVVVVACSAGYVPVST